MRIALTGGTGFVGRQILKTLLENGCLVRAIVRDKSKIGSISLAKNLEVLTCKDLFSEGISGLSSLLNGCEILVHVAWYAEPAEYLHSDENIKCLKGTLDLVQAFYDSGGKRFIGIGSCAEYELSKGTVDINTSLSPSTLYAATKVAAFQVLSHFTAQKNISFAWCRLFYLYGEGEDKRRLAGYIESQLMAGEEALLSNGDQIRDFLEVRDAAKLIVKVILSQEVGAVNICSGIGTSVRQFATLIAERLGRKDLLRFGARPNNYFDPPCVVGKIK